MYANLFKKKQKSFPHNSQGFTLIELLIVIVTMFLIFTIGFANLRGFQRTRTLDGATTKVKSALRYAQELALSGRSMAPCTLPGIRISAVRFLAAGTSYSTQLECVNAAGSVVGSVPIPENSFNLSGEYPGVVFALGTNTFFETLGRGVRAPVTIRLNQAATGQFREIFITRGGEIFEN